MLVYASVHTGTFSIVARCSNWWSRALSSFSDRLWFCSAFSSSVTRAPSLRAWALRWAPLVPDLPGVRVAVMAEDGAASGGWVGGVGDSQSRGSWRKRGGRGVLRSRRNKTSLD